ncbi:MAG: hypothetical protein ABJF10_20505 [Chthoniobacter sp.]|uniref:hypothetical protein n=1 Tax=Chthoniobacter sp. TaxID=2510640 RepID=UPI0032ADC9CB
MSAPVAFVLPAIPLRWLLLGSLVGYLLVMFTNPVRTNLRDGLRAVRRYKVLWFTLGSFGFAYALFQLALRYYFFCVLPPTVRPTFVWMREAWRDPMFWLYGSPESLWYLPPHALHAVVRDSALPALESVAGIFNLLVTTFPLSALAAALFLVNWDGHHGVLWHALRKRFGVWGAALHGGIVVCALAAFAKPFLYAAPQLLGLQQAALENWFQWAPVADWLAFLFEYLVGVCIQIGLMLIAYCWVRGLTFTQQHLVDFAIRRFSYVVRWAVLVMVLSSAFIHLPLILNNFAAFQGMFPHEVPLIDARLRIARGVITGILLIFASMQITLTFHSESLGKALHDHLRFLSRHWWSFGWFLVVAGMHFFLTLVFLNLVQVGLGDGTSLGIAWSFIVPWVNGFVAAWLLASWVCYYKHGDAPQTPTPEGAMEQGVLF